ncbi:hypothetical protein ACO1O0_003645 [Amphichorda felina]
MHLTQLLAALASLAAVAEAWNAPTYSGYTRNFNANFVGKKGYQPTKENWNIITGDANDNNEFQRWTNSKSNLQFSGEGTLQITPLRSTTAPKGWTSARIESKYLVSPKAGRITRVEAAVRMAGTPSSKKQGIWPAFWMMGDSCRKGTAVWPACGEIDIAENINGEAKSHAVVHCDKYPEGACKEPVGLVTTTPIDNKFHTWRLDFNRRGSDWKNQSLTWYKDGVEFHSVTGAQVNNADAWATLCAEPLYFILNVSVGGNWPGPPNSATTQGAGSMMEVGYVAVYTSNA